MLVITSNNPYRQKVYDKWAKLGLRVKYNTYADELRLILGIENFSDAMTVEQERLCELLSSEHGLTIYKMLLIKQGLG